MCCLQMARVKCTRWAELGESVLTTAEISLALGVRSDFCLLNPTPSGQFFTVGYDDGHISIPPNTLCDMQQLSEVMKESPHSRTPLTEAVDRITSMIAPVAEKLVAKGQRIAVVIATDGLPDNSTSFLRSLQQLQQLPCWVIVRLCTDEVRRVHPPAHRRHRAAERCSTPSA